MSITETESASANNIFNFTEEIHFPAHIDALFERLTAKDVEQFYSGYQLWLLLRRAGTLQTEIAILQQAAADNEEMMQGVAISPITLANLAQLQACGVNDVDLLDKMSERGEGWLDHTMQLLKYCEEIDVIRSNYTQWCEHALDGAYSWIASIAAEAEQETSTNLQTASSIVSPIPETDLQTASAAASSEVQSITEEEVLQKLMSDEGDTEKIPALGHNFGKDTQVHTTSDGSTDTITPDDADEPITVEIGPIASTTDKIEELASIAAEDDLHISGENNVVQEDALNLHPSDQDSAPANGHTQGDAPIHIGDDQDSAPANGHTPSDAPTHIGDDQDGPEEIPATAAEQETATDAIITDEMSVGEEISDEDMPDNKTSNIIEPEMLHEDDLTPTDKFVVLTVNQINGPVEIEDEQDMLNEDDITSTDKFVVLTVNQIDGPVEIDTEPEALHEDDLTPINKAAAITANPIAEPVDIDTEPDEIHESDITATDKAAAITANQIAEPVDVDTEPIAQAENDIDSPKQEISDATTAEEVPSNHPKQPTTQAVVALSHPKDKKSSLQKAQRRGFWWFLRKLLLSILRR